MSAASASAGSTAASPGATTCPVPRRVPLALGTARLRLRFPQEADWRALHAYFGDAQSVRYTTRRVLNEGETWRLLAGAAGHWAWRGYGPYVLERRSDVAAIGICGPWYPNDWPEPEIKWALLPSARGQGHVQEAALAVRAMLHAHLGWVPISLIDHENTASIKVARALGAQIERTIDFRDSRAHVFRHAAPAAWAVRPATAADASAIATLYLRSRRAHVVFAPLAHGDDEVRQHVRDDVLVRSRVWVALDGDGVVAFLALDRRDGADWIRHLYVAPARVSAGAGHALIGVALREAARPLRLHTFAANTGARRFYERYGFAAIAFGDGQGNEEGCPDVLYELA